MMKVLNKNNQTVIKGEVIHGRKIGRKIGYPTANLQVNDVEEAYLPKGVYGVKVHFDGVLYYGVMNIGMRPTFKGEESILSFEVHILHFNQDIYGEVLTIDILFFIRDEQAFDSIEQLIKQMKSDIEKAKKQFLLAEEVQKQLLLANY
jgi:riboflavin kinase/FMN adenylyltransferase